MADREQTPAGRDAFNSADSRRRQRHISDSLAASGREAIKGRGAITNPHNRYQPLRHEEFDDGWWQEASVQRPQTLTLPERSKTIISTNSSPDIPFDQSINPYRGCEHGCIYCYARPSHAYWDMSPGIDFETRIITRPNAAALLGEHLGKPSYVCKSINIGANTDPYQPLEARLQTTRQLLEVLQAHRHPFSVITKSALILRDLDILAFMAERNLCSVAVSITTLDNDLKRRLEPRTASPAARLRVVETLAAADIPVAVMAAPVIPAINDHELEKIIVAAADAGASSVNYILLRLPLEISQLFREWLALHFPDRADKVMSLVQSARGGQDYQAGFGKRMTGEGVFAQLLASRFTIALRRYGLTQASNHGNRTELDTSQFRRCPQQGDLFMT
ncbi:MAG: PA0069 family radical SAM protein [Pseudomonadales bacterium]|nr:PA0069 family radical SAM protein [Pseudomonadales bacterium]